MKRTSSGETIYLRPLEAEDFTERYLAWFRDPEVTQYLDAKNISREDAIAHLEEGKQENKWYIYAICEAVNGRHIGNLKIGPIHPRYLVSDLVTVIGERDAWGKGYAREAIKLGIKIAFEELGLRKISASIDFRNVGSLKAYTAGGFEVEATLKDQCMDLSSGEAVLSDMIYIACFNKNFDPKKVNIHM